jgi:hypothetical protein
VCDVTDGIATLITSGRIADLILAVMAAEAVLLIGLKVWTERGPSIASMAAMLISGGGLALALRGALTGASWTVIAAPLSISMVAHVAFLALAWREKR